MASMESGAQLEKALVGVLERERELYRKMLHLSHQKREAISLRDVERLKHITDLIHECLAEEESLSRKRQGIIKQISKDEGISLDKITLEEISIRWQNSYLEKLRRELKTIISELTKTNELNNRLIEQATDVLSFYRDLLYSFQEHQLGYNKQGLVEKQKGGYFEKEA